MIPLTPITPFNHLRTFTKLVLGRLGTLDFCFRRGKDGYFQNEILLVGIIS